MHRIFPDYTCFMKFGGRIAGMTGLIRGNQKQGVYIVGFLFFAVLFSPQAHADIEIPSVTLTAARGGITISDEPSNTFPQMGGATLSDAGPEWAIGFPIPWQQNLPAERAVIGIFKGASSEPVSPLTAGENFSFTHHALSPETSEITVSIPAPIFGNLVTPSGLYTLFVYELPETKSVCRNEEPFECFEEPYTDQDFLSYITTDPSQPDAPPIFPPLGGRSIVFEYVAGEAPGACVSECFSNVLFLPGIKATELYEGNSKRWLPGLFNLDGQRLAMNSAGESVNDIRVGDPMENAYGVLEIYDSFFNFLNDLKSTSIIADWQSAPYDWRYDVYDAAVQDQHLRDGSARSLIDKVHDLALTSKTGKVTIIAHSNGGLVGKALIDVLGVDSDLVDRFIMVGTPQLGTPSAVAAVLHGTGQGLPIDAAPFAMSKATSREVSENMPGVYGLLPLGGYFDVVADPVVEFAAQSFTGIFQTAYGETIDTASELISFLLGIGDGRTKPSMNDTQTPTILNDTLLTETRISRDMLESWVSPPEIETIQVAGWGLDTMRGFRYRERPCPLFSGCNTFLDIEPLLTAEGDGTVVSPSASALGGAYYLNMFAFNETNDTSWSHANILAATSVQDLLNDIITNSERGASYITTTKPIAVGKRVHLSVHSPVSIGIRDAQGRFTGVIPNPDPLSDIPVVIQDIPNTYYFEFGEGKYVGFQATEEFEIVMEGTGSGTFTLEIEEADNDTVLGTAVYTDLPVSTTTVATLNIRDLEHKGTLAVDENGDGSIDDIIAPDGQSVPLGALIILVRQKIETLAIKDKLKRDMLKKLDKLEKKVASKKGKNEKTIERSFRNIAKWITQRSVKGKISEADAQTLLDLISKIENAI